jgi:hypothetical protein
MRIAKNTLEKYVSYKLSTLFILDKLKDNENCSLLYLLFKTICKQDLVSKLFSIPTPKNFRIL